MKIRPNLSRVEVDETEYIIKKNKLIVIDYDNSKKAGKCCFVKLGLDSINMDNIVK